MSMSIVALIPAAGLLPESTLHSDAFAVLAAFVAINTVLYSALALAKVLPKIYLSDWVHRPDRRAETRSIHPDTDVEQDSPV